MRNKGKLTTALAAAVLVSAACASSYGKFQTCAELPMHRVLFDEKQQMPCERTLVEVGTVKGEPIRIACLSMGEPDADTVIFLIPGVLSDSRTWDYMVGPLGRDHYLVLIDLMGEGGSDKPDPNDLPDDAYSPDYLARQVLLVMRVKLAELGPDKRVVVMGHSLGGMVLLRALGDPELSDEFTVVVERVERVILLSPVDFAMERVHETFEEIATTSDTAFALALATGILRQRAAKTVFDGTVDPYHIPREEVDRLWEILSNRATRRAAQAMIRKAVPFDDNGRQRWTLSARIEREHGNIKVPCLILWGAQDETFGKAMGYKLQRQLHDAWFLAMDDCMHSLPSEKPVRCAQEAILFIRDGGDGRDRIVDEAILSTACATQRSQGAVIDELAATACATDGAAHRNESLATVRHVWRIESAEGYSSQG